MGYGGYSHTAHETITRQQAELPKEQLFTERAVPTDMDPYNMKPRESRDSADHPNSLAIAFNLDGTGSMDHIPEYMAREYLPGFMRAVIGMGIADPQILFSMIGDTFSDRKPLQVGQFESTAEDMNKWLRRYARGAFNGGGNGFESYHLGFKFLAERTSIDCYEKRGRRGYAIFTGDDHAAVSSGDRDMLCAPGLPRDVSEMRKVFGDIHEEARSVKDLLAEAMEKYHVFFIIPDADRAISQGTAGRHNPDSPTVEASWRALLGDRVIVANQPEDVCPISAVLIGLTEGVVDSLDDVHRRLRDFGTDPSRLGEIMEAITPYAHALAIGRTDGRTPAPSSASRDTPRSRRQARERS